MPELAPVTMAVLFLSVVMVETFPSLSSWLGIGISDIVLASDPVSAPDSCDGIWFCVVRLSDFGWVRKDGRLSLHPSSCGSCEEPMNTPHTSETLHVRCCIVGGGP